MDEGLEGGSPLIPAVAGAGADGPPKVVVVVGEASAALKDGEDVTAKSDSGGEGHEKPNDASDAANVNEAKGPDNELDFAVSKPDDVSGNSDSEDELTYGTKVAPDQAESSGEDDDDADKVPRKKRPKVDDAVKVPRKERRKKGPTLLVTQEEMVGESSEEVDAHAKKVPRKKRRLTAKQRALRISVTENSDRFDQMEEDFQRDLFYVLRNMNVASESLDDLVNGYVRQLIFFIILFSNNV